MSRNSVKDLAIRLLAAGEVSPFIDWLLREASQGRVAVADKPDVLDIRVSDLTAARFAIGPSPFDTRLEGNTVVLGAQDADLEPLIDVGWSNWRPAKSKDGMWLQLTSEPGRLRCVRGDLPVPIRMAIPVLGVVLQGSRAPASEILEIRRIEVDPMGRVRGVSAGPPLHLIQRVRAFA